MKKYLLVCSLLLSAFASANQELTLYFIPSPSGMDWSTPSSLVRTAARNKFSFRSHFMGHVWVELKCGSVHELTGMTDRHPDYLYQLVVEQRGLGILYHSFDGRLENKEDIQGEMPELFQEGRINFVTFLLNSSQCQRASLYLNQYRSFNVGRFYGLAHRPRFGEGSGCSAFGASFPEVLGFIDQGTREAWSQTVNIPLDLAGQPVTNEKVGLHKFIFGAKSWAQEDQKHRKLFFWDPDKMFQWVKKKILEKHSDIAIKKIGNSEGIILDKRIYPSPSAPVWLQRLNLKNKKEISIDP